MVLNAISVLGIRIDRTPSRHVRFQGSLKLRVSRPSLLDLIPATLFKTLTSRGSPSRSLIGREDDSNSEADLDEKHRDQMVRQLNVLTVIS